jgi:hypothetical protein
MPTKSAARARRELVERIQTEGAEAAYQALVAVARDPKAAAPARATAGSALFRAAGLLNAKPEDFLKREPSQMSYEELQEAIAALSEATQVETDEGVFD